MSAPASLEQESTVGAALALMVQTRPGFFLGGEARYLRQYEGIGLEELSGQALFVGPTAYFQLSQRSRLTASLERSGMGTSGRIECRASISSISNAIRRGWYSALTFRRAATAGCIPGVFTV